MTVRLFTPVATALLTAAGLLPLAGSAQAAPATTRLLVADPAASAVYVLDPSAGQVTGTFPGRKLNDHAGTVTLADGRVVFVDDAANELVVVNVSGRPRVVGTAHVEGEVSHFAVDATGRFAVVAGSEGHEHPSDHDHEHGHAALTAVDLTTFTSGHGVVHSGEPGVLIDNTTVLHRNDAPAQLESYRLDAITKAGGAHLTVGATKAIGEHGHGEAFSPKHRRAVTATEHGVDLTEVTRSGGFGAQRLATWGGPGRGFYLRLHDDADTAVTYVRDSTSPDWTKWTEHAYLLDVRSGRATRTPLGNGYVFRFGLSDSLAGYVVHGAARDELVLVDVNARDGGFGELTRRIDLGVLPGGPQSGTDPFTAQTRKIALDDAGRTAFLTAGGQGRVDVVETASGRVTGSLKVPSALDRGGAVAVWEPGVSHADTVGR
ncbi:YncE family protein [Allokutzneria oryzae]|uniref:YncE family protein n=1 Tax=Allokutzneria oryzae TaxID=1378989 RepID=A0ABV5ZZQ2_9PSEU